MRNLATLCLREVKAYIYSPIAYIVLCAFLVLNGWTFWECRLPGQGGWKIIKALRRSAG